MQLSLREPHEKRDEQRCEAGEVCQMRSWQATCLDRPRPHVPLAEGCVDRQVGCINGAIGAHFEHLTGKPNADVAVHDKDLTSPCDHPDSSVSISSRSVLVLTEETST